MGDFIEEFLTPHDSYISSKTSEEVCKDFIRAIIYKEIEFEFCTKK
jgi:hypothetical protein